MGHNVCALDELWKSQTHLTETIEQAVKQFNMGLKCMYRYALDYVSSNKLIRTDMVNWTGWWWWQHSNLSIFKLPGPTVHSNTAQEYLHVFNRSTSVISSWKPKQISVDRLTWLSPFLYSREQSNSMIRGFSIRLYTHECTAYRHLNVRKLQSINGMTSTSAIVRAIALFLQSHWWHLYLFYLVVTDNARCT